MRQSYTATLENLDERLEKRFEKKFATKQDLKELEERLEKRFEKKFATKQDLRVLEDRIDTKIAKHISASEIRTDIKMENMEKRIDDKARKYRDEVLTVMDGIAKDLKTILQEQIVAIQRIDRALDRIENHEVRITKLETKQNHN